MSEIVNLNKARKARAKVAAKSRAVENRASHGLTKSERNKARAEAALATRRLDQSRREVDEP